jgi:hypothetical protein
MSANRAPSEMPAFHPVQAGAIGAATCGAFTGMSAAMAELESVAMAIAAPAKIVLNMICPRSSATQVGHEYVI